jgi:RNA-directed DNA polymerase
MQYTRYADDMTFSVGGSFSRSRALQIVREATDQCRGHGFEVHHAKTRIVPPGSRHIVLGLLVDGPNPRLSKQLKSRVRTHIHGVARHGLPAHVSARRFSSLQGLVNHVHGLIRFAFDIEPEWALEAMRDWTSALRSGNWPVDT